MIVCLSPGIKITIQPYKKTRTALTAPGLDFFLDNQKELSIPAQNPVSSQGDFYGFTILQRAFHGRMARAKNHRLQVSPVCRPIP